MINLATVSGYWLSIEMCYPFGMAIASVHTGKCLSVSMCAYILLLAKCVPIQIYVHIFIVHVVDSYPISTMRRFIYVLLCDIYIYTYLINF